MIVEKRENGRVVISMAEAELGEIKTAQRWYKDQRNKKITKANRAVAKKYNGDVIITWILKLNAFLNKIIERHKQYAWERALKEAEENDR